MAEFFNGMRYPPSMRDSDVRAAVRHRLNAQHAGDQDTRIVEEMGIWSGAVRIDIAVINGELSGFELKSDRDTLQRLPYQADLYSRVFDRIVLVTGAKHYEKADALIPKWWGVSVAVKSSAGLDVQDIRPSDRNADIDPVLVAQLLWKQEAIAALESLGIARGWRSKRINEIHRRLATEVPTVQLKGIVRASLKRRSEWLGQPVSDE